MGDALRKWHLAKPGLPDSFQEAHSLPRRAAQRGALSLPSRELAVFASAATPAPPRDSTEWFPKLLLCAEPNEYRCPLYGSSL